MSLIGNTALKLDEEQSMLLEVARNFCRERGGLEAARQHLETPLDHDPDLWSNIVQMGWCGIGIPDALGGAGLGIDAAVPILECMGRSLLGTPLLSTMLAGQLLHRAGGEACASVLTAIAAGAPATVAELESEDWGATVMATQVDEAGRLQGEKRLVMDMQTAHYCVVTAQRNGRTVLALIDAGELDDDAVTPRVLMDNTHRAADVMLRNVAPVQLIEGPLVDSALRDYRLLGALLVAAESTGAAAACLDVTVDYLKTRKQFGKYIGSFQALKHPAVEILNMVDAAKSFIYHAATVLSESPLGTEQEMACHMAKAQATEALQFAGDRAVQFHGGMGFTWDCDAQLFLRRAQWAQQQFGDAQYHRQCLGPLLFA